MKWCLVVFCVGCAGSWDVQFQESKLEIRQDKGLIVEFSNGVDQVEPLDEVELEVLDQVEPEVVEEVYFK